ncbi:16S rRNA (cytosine(1402)-N(4))-methyltransferase RsmH [Pelagibacterales bacterium SAG-MED11]|nr:16S rRNA (cytosine(1402)-N(4))-methyltransferase RsmH [Pelagibacterales bacterium SAG-MED11]
MQATMQSDVVKHYPVLLNELISIITPQYGGTFIDCTFGQGGYTKKILSYQNTQVIALDRDLESKKKADKISKDFQDRFIFKNKKFSQLDDLKIKNTNVRGIIFDLGYSTTQIKDPKKGLSFNSLGDLNMQMGLNDFSAKEVINRLDEKDLEKIFKFFGEEKYAKKIASSIVKQRSINKIDTKSLVELIEKTKKKKNFKIHSATKVFQALRIFVNKEITELIYGLIAAAKVLKKDGILAVVTFHSLEDKIVKHFFKSLSEKKSISRYIPKIEESETLFRMLEKKPRTPSKTELKENLPSRSAKLRYIIKKDDFYNFKTDILEKFEYLIEIENFGNKL